MSKCPYGNDDCPKCKPDEYTPLNDEPDTPTPRSDCHNATAWPPMPGKNYFQCDQCKQPCNAVWGKSDPRSDDGELRILWQRIKRQGLHADNPIKYTEFIAALQAREKRIAQNARIDENEYWLRNRELLEKAGETGSALLVDSLQLKARIYTLKNNEAVLAALTPKTTLQDVVTGTPSGLAVVQEALERSAEVIEAKSTEPGQHYLVMSGEESTYIQHPNSCPTEEIGNDDGKYIVYKCEVADHDDGLDLDDYFETKKLGPGKYPIEAWSGRNWTDYGWEYDGGLVFSTTPQDSTPPPVSMDKHKNSEASTDSKEGDHEDT